ncbi:MAG: prolyl oligopeptidase family serine peptidase [Candidatus Marinimicrobia bacterium]|jgi:S-formylglutathione hydrolase FrmB|nr:prolyl oligopeptidase family serine peptidase [Candidatus Neomarinimicrobiota bacterium]MBT3630976.1 prolyl oligopeptidase family serine peptidase [Candidatus Neomarinimicrobiota bacterium]MBT3823930.1 prolyl oligopeptidase family serine peptidase [Candidatus Neomarinimicrobiota bacterium]MBT4130796.1 prolyl oligopeptidase family serine peptidase [Candidatus Neomarinimicrobiota bacterium]MBT4296261.1 prolyl oligopeptidase family serine peptidase [Candidatus Neomarinimicrobiota bacterium]
MKSYKNIFATLIMPVLVLTSFSPALGDILHLKAPSVALSDSNRVIVATPSQFDPHLKGGYPFIVMLHGWSGDETQWEDDSDLQNLCDTYNLLLILPDGGYDGWWVDSEVSPGRNYATHIHQEIKIWVVENFNGSMNPASHGVMGLSMGGFGAITQVLKYPDSYAAAASLSGVMDITRHTENWHLTNALGLYAEDPDRWESNNPLHLAEKKAPRNSPDMLLVCGRDDFTFKENQEMAKQLEDKGYKIVFREESGTHSHAFWKTHVESAIKFIVSHFNM